MGSQVTDACCKNHKVGQCCGNGPCNIFCCNCDDGCDQGCQTAKLSSTTSMDVWLDAFLTLDRFSLDAVQICKRSFRRITDERLTDVCLRRLESVDVCLHSDNENVADYSAALRSGTRRVDIKEPEMELFTAKFKGALLPSTISFLVVNSGKDGNIEKATAAFDDIWSRTQVQGLAVGLTTKDDPQKCYDFILSASPQSCSFDFARVVYEGSVAGKRAPSQFFTDRRLRECLAHKITQLDFEHVSPADAGGIFYRFPLSDDGIVDFLFGNPELKRKRGLIGGYTSASVGLFKRLVQAHLESEIVEDI